MAARSVLATAAASVCLAGCGALLDLPDNPRAAEDAPSAGHRAATAPGARFDRWPPAASAAAGAAPVSGPATAAAINGPSDAGTERPLIGSDTSDGSVASAEREAGVSRAPPDATPGPDESVAGEAALAGDELVETALVCPPIRRASITDFSVSDASRSTQTEFDLGAAFRGGTFSYPDRALGLGSDVTQGDWHLSGTVRATSGFGLVSLGCRQLDASAYLGIAFTLSGQLDEPLVFFIESAAHQVSHVWLNENDGSGGPAQPENLGRCIPNASRYDGSCREPRTSLRVLQAPTEFRILWTALSGGSPEPAVDPSEITSIAWALPEPVDGPYVVDVHIDSLRFISAATP